MDGIKMNGILEDEKNGRFYIETNQRNSLSMYNISKNIQILIKNKI